MEVYVNKLSVIPVRKDPAHKSEMVTQLLFGELVEAGEVKDGFTEVRCIYDNYPGWVQSNQLMRLPDQPEMLGFTAETITDLSLGEGSIIIPYGSPMFKESILNTMFPDMKSESYRQPLSLINTDHKSLSIDWLKKCYQPFLSVPYLWGGKSVFGIDCSGFVQQVFKLCGVYLLRDASQQAMQGEFVKSLAESKAGDLAFFRNEKGSIIHVGILLTGTTIVHASGQVRIDNINDEGIFNAASGLKTHDLAFIKRMVDFHA